MRVSERERQSVERGPELDLLDLIEIQGRALKALARLTV